MNTKLKNILCGLLMVVPSLSYANPPEITKRSVPFSRIYDTVQQHPALYNSDFVFFLENQITDNKYTLGNLAQACIDYTQHNNAVTHEICTEFIDSIIGSTILTDLNKTFVATTTSDATEFKFTISAAGNFTVDCGDGSPVQQIRKTTIEEQEITCSYSKPAEYKVIIGGRAEDYASDKAAIGFSKENATNSYVCANLAGIDGTLGAIFPTLGDKQPIFKNTFNNCRNLFSQIPANLFKGIDGAPVFNMFNGTFANCVGLSGQIPETLFAGIKGQPVPSMFSGTFSGCSGLSGQIPEDLFAGIDGAPVFNMFSGTFSGCSGLSGQIPENLFARITGRPADGMFINTFAHCRNLSGQIPANLFKGIEGEPAQFMFADTFGDCSGLFGQIPANLFAGINGAPASYMFFNTFSGCSGLTGTIPENLFKGISGAPAEGMFRNTFSGCSKLSGAVGYDFFGKITPPIDKKYVESENIFTNTNVNF